MSNVSRNSLTIAETKDILCAEHAARVFVARTWWHIVPNKEDSYAQTGDARPFWGLVTATKELGQPLGFKKVENKLGKLVNVAHNDVDSLLRSLIKVQPRADKPVMAIIEARCKISGKDPKELYNERMLAYNEELAAEEARVTHAVNAIMAQEPLMDQDGFGVTSTKLGAFDEATGEYEEFEVDYTDEVSVPIDWIIDFAEKQLKFLANNSKVPDIIFGTEHALWEGELAVLRNIVQQQEHEGSGEQSREIDEALLSASGMQAGGNSGK